MSLSSERQSNWGTIFMGPGPSMETTLERVEAGGPSLAWTADTEAEYLARVREKATAKAKEIIAAAQAEARILREQAHAQGYEAGLDQAQAELEEFRQGMGASVDAVLAAIENNAGRVAANWRKELASLARLCVETAVNHELSTERAALLAGLFDGAAAKMEAAQRIVILVNPEDEPAVADMLDAAGRGDDRTFTVRGEAALEPGSLVLESDDSRVDNSLTVRRALVENILAQLTLPGDAPEDAPAAADETEAPLGAEPAFTPELADLEQAHFVEPAASLQTEPLETSAPAEAEPMAQAVSGVAETAPDEMPAQEPQAAAAEMVPAEAALAEQVLPEVLVEPGAPELAPTQEEFAAEEFAPGDPAGEAAVPPELDPFEAAQAALDKEQSQS